MGFIAGFIVGGVVCYWIGYVVAAIDNEREKRGFRP